MPETKAPTQAQVDFFQKQVVRLLLELQEHKRRLRHNGRRQIKLAELYEYMRFLPSATQQFLRLFLLRFWSMN